jgi:glucose-6-phosphate isomerase
MMDLAARWARYKSELCVAPAIGLSVDVSRMGHEPALYDALAAKFATAFSRMSELEKGAIANPDEKRMVGHYWLRDPSLAPNAQLRADVEVTNANIKAFAADVHAGKILAAGGQTFTDLLLVGIGGSALGPQFVTRALGGVGDRLTTHFFDNTDPDGMDLVLERIGQRLSRTLVVVISKSGGTKETRNGMLEAQAAFTRAGLAFAPHFVAVTGVGSELDGVATKQGWLARFPMFDWIGGRTSELSAVGLLPAALAGYDIDALLEGARLADAATRVPDVRKNPAALLAATWFHAGGGKGEKDMVVLPYKDRLELFSRYLQQLVMESLGKERDLDGNVVHQGIAVYGNKGSTDQHAYVQQLRDGVRNFFAVFIEVLRDRPAGAPFEVEPEVHSGDYLHGFLLGTRRALYESGRPSITITVEDVSPRTVGALIALFERAVGFYATLVNINAYHQPGVEAGKKAAAEVLAVQHRVLGYLRDHGGAHDAEAIAAGIGEADVETVFKVLSHLAINPGHGVRRVATDAHAPWTATFAAAGATS